jgi:polyhydroxybutyrate depolymerase
MRRRTPSSAAATMRAFRWLRRARPRAVWAATAVGAVVAIGAATPAAAADRCVRPDVAGATTVDVHFDGTSYPVLVHVPESAGSARVPLVLNLHGSSTNGSIQMQISGMRSVADDEGFVVAAPNGAIPVPPPPGGQHPDGSWAWNVPGVPLTVDDFPPPTARDDIRFLSRVIDVVSQRFCTARSRTYATGFSGGARMVSALACRIAEKLTAIAPVAGLRAGRAAPEDPAVPEIQDCRPRRPVPVLTFHGRQDPVNAYLGNDHLRWGYSVPVAVQTWARLDGCRRGPRATHISQTTTRFTYTDCRDDATVGLYRIADGSHSWPGPTGSPLDVDATRIMWEFFERHR